MALCQTLIEPDLLVDSLENDGPPTYVSESEPSSEPDGEPELDDTNILSPSPFAKRAYEKTNASFSSRRDLFPSMDRAVLQELSDRSDDQSHTPRWVAQLR